jgi:hypothetical protein
MQLWLGVDGAKIVTQPSETNVYGEIGTWLEDVCIFVELGKFLASHFCGDM